jgi:hypothetical protein
MDTTESDQKLSREVTTLTAILVAIIGGIYWLMDAISDWLS